MAEKTKLFNNIFLIEEIKFDPEFLNNLNEN